MTGYPRFVMNHPCGYQSQNETDDRKRFRRSSTSQLLKHNTYLSILIHSFIYKPSHKIWNKFSTSKLTTGKFSFWVTRSRRFSKILQVLNTQRRGVNRFGRFQFSTAFFDEDNYDDDSSAASNDIEMAKKKVAGSGSALKDKKSDILDDDVDDDNIFSPEPMLSPQRVAMVGAALIAFGMTGFLMIPGLLVEGAKGSPLVNSFYCSVMTLTTYVFIRLHG
jgi:hypothetical protein